MCVYVCVCVYGYGYMHVCMYVYVCTGIIGVRRVTKEDMKQLAKATGGECMYVCMFRMYVCIHVRVRMFAFTQNRSSHTSLS